MIRLVLFDIDGTLIRTGGAGVQAFADVFASEFNARDHFERLKFAGRTDYGIVREFFTYHDIEPCRENFDRFFRVYAGRLQSILENREVTVCPGIREFIDRARRSAQPPVIGLLTGNVKIGAQLKLARVGLWETFETGGFADDHEERDHIAAVARERGAALAGGDLKDHEVLVIGDTPLDIRCARAINARVLAVGTGGATMQDLEQHRPDYLAANLSEFREEWLNGQPV